MDMGEPLVDADLVNRVGLEANKLGDSAMALRFFLAASRLAPSDPRFLLSAGNMHLKLGEADNAMAVYETLQTLELTEKQANMIVSKLDEVAMMKEAGAACQ